MARAGAWLFGLSFVSVVGVGCSLVLDIPDRQLDPDFDDAGATINDDAGDASAACISYCNQVATNCVTDPNGDHAVYASQAVCLAVCSQLPAGTSDASSGNSVACRARQAALPAIIGEPGSSCPAAGPGGGSADPDGGAICGTNCEGYCSLMQANCSFVFTDDAGAFDTDKCMAACALVPDIGNFNVSLDEQKGNSIQCRLYHVSAATQDPTVHCVHAAGINTCVE